MSNWNQIQNKLDVKLNKLAVPVGKVPGILFTVFGSIGTVGFGIPVIVLTILGYVLADIRLILHPIAWGLLIPFVISITSFMNGNRIRKRLQRFQRYTNRLNNRYYCLIKELSSATGQSDKATVKDLQKMIGMGMFPEGHIDEQSIYFMLNNQYYEEYLKLQQSAKLKALEAKALEAKKIEVKGNKKVSHKNQLTKEQQTIINDGRQLIKAIKNANDLIPGEELSNKLDRLEEVGEKIFEYVEGHPEKLPQIKRFTEYFLPTTLKLADTYAKLDYQPIQGENISTAKKEIEKTMDTIYAAFENLLDGLFEDIALDISTDISVLETMFAQEGLTENNINFKTNHK